MSGLSILVSSNPGVVMAQTDPLVRLLKSRPDVLELLGRIWEILYIEGSSPDIGKRREDVIREMLREEFGLEVKSAPSTEREWDFYVIIEGKENRYSLKTTEDIAVIKVAWNGFPSIDRARKFQFKYPILYITGNRREREVSIYVFEIDDLEELREEMKDEMWWIPRGETNPRGFGIKAEAVRRLMEKARNKGNFVSVNYNPINTDIVKERYWRIWYNMLKKLALEG
ncbi:hypothetical protein [Candidatus Methanodesulfokora washburnensis]|jgi:hypothetical protein|uniref:hypothetical protein n=1 Tax=Candidatus Methanodesulfokora washburnensis TaxID=2478471 RepID=UPI000F771746|nr:hypothetical protein [Candidatus Methanodesulfokores washburnensis]